MYNTIWCLQCFDAVGWAAGRASVLYKTEWCGDGVVICLERDADLHMVQLMPLPLTVSCFSKVQIRFTFLVPAHPRSPDKGSLNGCVCMCVHNRVKTRTALQDLLDSRQTERQTECVQSSWPRYELSESVSETVGCVSCVKLCQS